MVVFQYLIFNVSIIREWKVIPTTTEIITGSSNTGTINLFEFVTASGHP